MRTCFPKSFARELAARFGGRMKTGRRQQLRASRKMVVGGPEEEGPRRAVQLEDVGEDQ